MEAGRPQVRAARDAQPQHSAPTDPVLNEHLGDAYWKVGRHHEARFQWSRAMSFEPEPELVPVLQKKLEEGLAEEPKVKSEAGECGSGG